MQSREALRDQGGVGPEPQDEDGDGCPGVPLHFPLNASARDLDEKLFISNGTQAVEERLTALSPGTRLLPQSLIYFYILTLV